MGNVGTSYKARRTPLKTLGIIDWAITGVSDANPLTISIVKDKKMSKLNFFFTLSPHLTCKTHLGNVY